MANARISVHPKLVDELTKRPASEAAKQLGQIDASTAYEALSALNPAFAQDILAELAAAQRQTIIAAAPLCRVIPSSLAKAKPSTTEPSVGAIAS